jgi:hypothetical protein
VALPAAGVAPELRTLLRLAAGRDAAARIPDVR